MSRDTATRWRLLLGRYAERRVDAEMSAAEARMDRALDYLYQREYKGRGVRRQPSGQGRGGGMDPTALRAVDWLGEVRELFPQSTVETLEKHALERFDLKELVNDRELVARLEPSMDLLKTLLTFQGTMQSGVREEVRRIARAVTEEVRRRLEQRVQRTILGRFDRFRRSPLQVANNFDARATIRRNLQNYDPALKRLIIEEVRFFSRVRRHLPWRIILCVDQSGSMTDSLIFSAVMASILAGLPAVSVQLVAFDTSIVDLSQYVDDPVDLLMNVQLGGGTDIGRALDYCTQLVEEPKRTILTLISDFEEGCSPRRLVRATARLAESGVKLLALAALDERGTPYFDRKMAEQLVAVGMQVAALTPDQFAEWIAGAIE